MRLDSTLLIHQFLCYKTDSKLNVSVLWMRATAALVFAVGLSGCSPETSPSASAPKPATAAQVEHGAYLARIGNCEPCHTERNGEAFAGGRAVDTPFGQVVSSNITPDPVHGLGRWSADDFWRAMHHGRSQDGRLLYPAFPYPSFTHVTRDDSDALWAYLQTVAPVARARGGHNLRWPYSTQAALWVWRALYFDVDPAAEHAVKKAGNAASAELDRGKYLVEGLGHCNECHGARSTLGALKPDGPQGSVLSGSGWYAPSLLDRAEASVADWSEDDVLALLYTGVSERGYALGPMAEVVRYGTQHLNTDDARAMARYLRQLPQTNSRPSAADEPAGPEINAMVRQGRALYERHCEACHGANGQGQPGVYPALAGNRAVNMTRTNNLAHIVLAGGFSPSTHNNPRPYGMPPFVLTLSDAELATVLSYVRYQWGNTAAPLSEFDITSMRR